MLNVKFPQIDSCVFIERYFIQSSPFYSTTLEDYLQIISVDKLKVVSDLTESIQAFHSNNVIHGRIKMSNIFYDKSTTRPVIIDQSQYLLTSINHSFSMIDYYTQSPVVLSGKEIDISVDIWAFLCIINYIFKGKYLFEYNNVLLLYEKTKSFKLSDLLLLLEENIKKDIYVEVEKYANHLIKTCIIIIIIIKIYKYSSLYKIFIIKK